MTLGKLGKKAAVYDRRTLMFAKYLLPKFYPPAAVDNGIKVASWPMMLNDSLGDCTCASAGHMIQEWTTDAGLPFCPTDAQILKAYENIGGYRPSDPSSDNGAVLLDVLNYWRKNGIGEHHIMAYTGLEPKNHSEIMDSIWLFGGCYIGVQLPVSAQGKSYWSVPQTGLRGDGEPGSWGGHAIPAIAYDARGLTVISWGQRIRMSWNFLAAYCDEAYAVLSKDWIAANAKAPNNYDLTTLQYDLGIVSA